MTQYGVSAGMPGELPGDADLPVLSLEATTLRAEPGGQAQTTLTLKNPGQLVESFRLDVVGLDDGWWQVHPPELALYPGEDATAVVVLTPPAAARAPDRPLPFGVRAISTLDSSRGVVEEGDLEVGRVFDLQPAISPVTSRARWSARHTITFTNWGNSPVRLRLSASDKDGRLGFRLAPEALAVPVGGSATARLRVRPSDPFLRGSPVHLPFQVRGESPGPTTAPGPRSVTQRAGVPDPTQPVIDAAVLQGPILSRGVVVVLTALVLAIAAALALLFRIGDVKGARNDDTAPLAPTAVSASPVTGTLVRIAWTGNDRALGYTVHTIDANGSVTKSDDVKGGVDAFDAKVDAPATKVCYEVFAVRGEYVSPPSERQCATTPDERLKPPTDLQAVPGGGGKFQVSWKGSEKNQHAVLLDKAAAAPDVGTGILSALIDVPAGHHCVTVVARRGDSASPPSDQQCVDSTGPGASPTTGTGGGPGTVPGGGGGGGGASPTSSTGSTGSPNLTGFLAVLGVEMQRADNLAGPLAAQLQSQNIPAQVVPAAAVPNMPGGPFSASTVFVVVQGFASEAAVQQFCTTTTLPQAAQPCVAVRAGA